MNSTPSSHHIAFNSPTAGHRSLFRKEAYNNNTCLLRYLYYNNNNMVYLLIGYF